MADKRITESQRGRSRSLREEDHNKTATEGREEDGWTSGTELLAAADTLSKR